MTVHDVSLMLAILGGSLVFLAWVGRRTGDAPRDVALMLGIGATMSAASGVVYAVA